MYESNFTADAELDNILSLYLFDNSIEARLFIIFLPYIYNYAC